MQTKINQPSASRFWAWFNPLNRQSGSIAFILNRITALGLTLYLYLHLIMLGKLAQGAESYDGFIALVRSPIFIFGELLVVAAVIIHGLNGIRIGLTSFNIGTNIQKPFFYVLMGISIIGILYFAVRMFAG